MEYTSREEPLCALDLPDEVLVLILGHLPLLDLATARLVCRRLQRLIDSSSHVQLWSSASLDGVWVAPSNSAILERAAQQGNMEALIKLAVAYLYSEGVPDGPGKGTMDSINARKVAQYLIHAESLSHHTQPFSWLLIRPPLAASTVCCKACVCHRMQQHCRQTEDKVSYNRLFYCIGKALTFLEEEDMRQESLQWFEEGESNECLYSSYELWKLSTQPLLQGEAVQHVRDLRKIVSSGSVSSRGDCVEARFELGKLYVKGHYGGVSRTLAYLYLRQLISSSQALLSRDVLHAQSHLTEEMLYILVDWLAEVSEMKAFPSATVHLAVSIAHRYMLRRVVSCSKLQLLGISALLVASRWLGMTIITMREASWLTDSTYRYEHVVRMTGELVAVLKGDIRSATVADYLEMLLLLVSADYKMSCMAYYLSECALLYTDFGRFTAAHVAACCLLLTRVLLDHEYPWSVLLGEATGFTLSDLHHCTTMLYDKCLTDKYPVTDHRGVRLCGVSSRYAEDRFMGISQVNVMSYQDLMDKLGLIPSPPPTQPHSKLFSFLSDSQYQSADDSLVNTSFLDKFGTQRLTDSHRASSSSPTDTVITAGCSTLQPLAVASTGCSSLQPLAVASSPIHEGQLGRSSSLPPLPSVSPVLTQSPVTVDSDSDLERPSSTMSLPPLAPSHSEETVTSNLLPASTRPGISQAGWALHLNAHRCGQQQASRPAKPLQSIENHHWRLNTTAKNNVTEKRSPHGTLAQTNRTKRRRHSMMNRQV